MCDFSVLLILHTAGVKLEDEESQFLSSAFPARSDPGRYFHQNIFGEATRRIKEEPSDDRGGIRPRKHSKANQN